MERATVGYPLLLLDNNTLAYILGNGEFKFTNLKFDEAKAILDMNPETDIRKCFLDSELDDIIYDYLDIERREFEYEPARTMEVGQDAIAFKRYITPSGTQPIILGEEGEQAKKVKNVYIYCQHVVRLK